MDGGPNAPRRYDRDRACRSQQRSGTLFFFFFFFCTLLLSIHSPMQQPLHCALGDCRRNWFFAAAGCRVVDDDVGLSRNICLEIAQKARHLACGGSNRRLIVGFRADALRHYAGRKACRGYRACMGLSIGERYRSATLTRSPDRFAEQRGHRAARVWKKAQFARINVFKASNSLFLIVGLLLRGSDCKR